MDNINYRKIIRGISHEKNYELYKSVKKKDYFSRLYVFAKEFYHITKGGYLIKGPRDNHKLLFHVVGTNQNRLHEALFCAPNDAFNELFRQYPETTKNHRVTHQYFNIWQLAKLCCLLSMTLFSRRPGRRLLIFNLAVFKIIQKVVKKDYSNLECFVSYNDQSLLTACIVLNLKQIECKTIVFQHGIVFRPLAYFPCNSDEFWAWGPIVKKYGFAGDENTTCRVTGRFSSDIFLGYSPEPTIQNKKVVLLVALGWRWSEMIRDLSALNKVGLVNQRIFTSVQIKLHPSVKFKAFFRLYLKLFCKDINEEQKHIEDVLGDYSALYTRNSTVTLDFLLAGKRVFLSDQSNFPRDVSDCCLSIVDACTANSRGTQPSRDTVSRLLTQFLNVN